MTFRERLLAAIEVLSNRTGPERTVDTAYALSMLKAVEAEIWEREHFFSTSGRAVTPSQVAANRVAHDIIDQVNRELAE